jgi:hypothetical protein
MTNEWGPGPTLQLQAARQRLSYFFGSRNVKAASPHLTTLPRSIACPRSYVYPIASAVRIPQEQRYSFENFSTETQTHSFNYNEVHLHLQYDTIRT